MASGTFSSMIRMSSGESDCRERFVFSIPQSPDEFGELTLEVALQASAQQ